MIGLLCILSNLSIASAEVEPEERVRLRDRWEEREWPQGQVLALKGAAIGYGSMVGYTLLTDGYPDVYLLGGPPAAAIGATVALRFSSWGASSAVGELGGSVLGAGLGFVTGIGLSIPLVVPLMHADPPLLYTGIVRMVQIAPPILGAAMGGWWTQRRILENRGVVRVLPYGNTEEGGILLAGRF